MLGWTPQASQIISNSLRSSCWTLISTILPDSVSLFAFSVVLHVLCRITNASLMRVRAPLGWDGWGCTDNTEAYSYGFQLLSTLLLCLSNLMFVPPVTIAIRSQYLLEASVYIFTMFFSTVSLLPRIQILKINSICQKWGNTNCIHKLPVVLCSNGTL